MMHKGKLDRITSFYLRQLLCAIALPLLLCIIYFNLLHVHNENQVKEALGLEVNAVITQMEDNHSSREEQINRYFLQSRVLRSALLDTHESGERAQVLYYASQAMQDTALVDLDGSSGVTFVSQANDVCIGTDLVQGSLSLLWRMYYASQPTLEAWQAKYLQEQANVAYYRDSYAYNASSGKYGGSRITRVSYYTGRNQKNYWILIWWYENDFAEGLKLSTHHQASFAVYNALNQPVIQQADEDHALEMQNETREGVWISSLQGRRVFLARKVSPDTGMSYCYAVDYAEAMADFSQSSSLMFFLLVLCVCISTLFSMGIARKNAKPIHEISTALEAEQGTVVANNFQQLSTLVQKTIDEKKSAWTKSLQNRQYMKQAILRKIMLEGESASASDAEELGIRHWDGYCVMILHVSIPLSEDINCDADNIQASFINIIQTLSSRSPALKEMLVWPDKTRIGVLLPVAQGMTGDDILHTGERIIAEVKQLPHVKVRAGIGQTVGTCQQIARSYYFAKAALSEAARLDLPIFASCTVQSVNDTLYSERREKQLTNLLRQGNTHECERLLQEMYAQGRNATPANLQMLLWSLLLTMQRLACGYNDSQLMETVDHATHQMEQCCISKEFDAVFGSILALSDAFCTYMQKQEKSRGAAFEEFIHAHYAEADFGMQHMLDRFNMSQTSFQTEFKRSLGITFGKYLENLRMNYAAEMLCQGRMNITEIALHCGYLSDVSFRRVFKKYYGVAPTEYKKSRNG